jgi:divalent metal cation (Fe/Co/Zn/Cd) transporter
VLAVYLTLQSVVVLATRFHPHHSVLGIVWTGATAVVMLWLAREKSRTGRALGNEVLLTEGRVTFVDAVLATAVLVGLTLNALLGWWWADPLAGFVIVLYGVKEGIAAFGHASSD